MFTSFAIRCGRIPSFENAPARADCGFAGFALACGLLDTPRSSDLCLPRTTAMSFPAGVVTETSALSRAPWYRREPYLVFFPLGIAMSWAGVGHWLLHAVGVLETYRPIFHAMAQIQCFMMSFAAGFLLTMIPRRTGSMPPSTWEVVVCAVAPVVTAVAAWNERWVLSQAAWLALAITLIQFAVRRFTSATAKRRKRDRCTS